MTLPMAIAGATRIGRKHVAEGNHNQDSYQYRILPNQRTVVAAVSDGAGSAPRAKLGSFTAVRYAVAAASDELSRKSTMQQALKYGLKAAIEAIRKMADQDPIHQIEDYHSTLILAAWTPQAVAAIQVGDGAAIVTTQDGTKMLTIPQQGEYANETYFITMPQAEEIAFFNQTESADTLTIFTDGLQKQAIDFAHKRPNADFINSAIAVGTHDNDQQSAVNTASSSWLLDLPNADIRLHQWLSDEGVAQDNADDTTLVVASRIPHDV